MFATGRTIKRAGLGESIKPVTCDHTNDHAVEDMFRQVEGSAGRLDILVNVVWGGYQRMDENGQFTFIRPVLAATVVALGRHGYRCRTGSLRGQPARRTNDGSRATWP